MIGAKIIANALKDLGIERVYLYPGGTIAPLLDELVNIGIEYICSRNEQGAGYAAIGAAKLTNKPQVVIVTSGPGATNALTPVADAFYDSVPLIVITGQVGTSDINWERKKRQTGFQETDTIGIFKPVTKSAKILSKEMDLYSEIVEAYNTTIDGRFGPVLLDLPMDVQRTKPNVTQSLEVKPKIPQQVIVDVQYEDIIGLIKQSSHPLILAGNGIYLSGATKELKEFVEKTQIPIVSSLPGVGCIDTNHELYFGYIGHTGEFYANLAMYYSDLLIVLGARLDLRQTGSEVKSLNNKKIIHVDIDNNELDLARLETHIKILTDNKEFLSGINKYIQKNKSYVAWEEKLKYWKNKYASDKFYKDSELSSYHIIKKTSQYLKDKKVIVTSGVGTHQQLVARYFNFAYPQKVWFTSAGHGTMGYDIPTAIGALIQDTSYDLAIVFVGDGSFQMNIQELATIANMNLPIKIFVLDNQRLGIVSQFQLLNWETDESTGNKINPSFSKIATAYNLKSYDIRHKSEIEKSLKEIFSDNLPTLIHCHIDIQEDVLPMLMGGQKMNEMYPFKNSVDYEE